MRKIADYSLLFQNICGMPKRNQIKRTTIKQNPIRQNRINNIQVSQLNSKSVRAQLKAAGVDINSKQYKAVIKQMMQDGKNGAMYTNVQAIKNLMKGYNKDGDYVGPGGIIVPGMIANGIPESERHQIIDVSEESRQKMFDETKRHFLKVLDSVTRESVDNALVQSGNKLILPRKTMDIGI